VRPDLVSVLIGVNDLVQGRTADQYRASLRSIYDAIDAVTRVVAVSIPTWSYVPAAAQFGGPQHVDTLTRVFNDVAEAEARAREFTWVDIAEASTSGVGTEGWIASDQLHPGDAQYAAWAEVIWRAISSPSERPRRSAPPR
jgi:lysophospholipase L1-like esterase